MISRFVIRPDREKIRFLISGDWIGNFDSGPIVMPMGRRRRRGSFAWGRWGITGAGGDEGTPPEPIASVRVIAQY